MSKILIQNGTIVNFYPHPEVLEGHSLLIENEQIQQIAPKAEFTGRYDKTIDARNKLVMPGLICAHMHFYSTFARGLGKAKPSKNFKEVLENLWWRLDKKLTLEDSYYSALIPLIDGIKRGTTTFIDHHASPFAVTGSLNMIARAVKETGLRASLCYELSDRDGDPIATEGIRENVDFIKRCQQENDPQLKALFGLHAAFTLSDQTLEKAARLGNELGVGFHVHTAEADSDQAFNETEFGLRVVERFHKFNILGPKTILAHCVHITDPEIDRINDSDTLVVHNPQSNMNNAVGVMDLIKLSARGILVGLGTDAMTVNMLEELRSALWVHHLSQKDPSCAFMETVKTLFVNNPKIAARYWNLGLGQLKAGNAADIILIDYCSPTPFNSDTIWGHAVFGISQSFVDTTIASGKVLMENRKLCLPLEEEAIAKRAQELSSRLWDQF